MAMSCRIHIEKIVLSNYVEHKSEESSIGERNKYCILDVSRSGVTSSRSIFPSSTQIVVIHFPGRCASYDFWCIGTRCDCVSLASPIAIDHQVPSQDLALHLSPKLAESVSRSPLVQLDMDATVCLNVLAS